MDTPRHLIHVGFPKAGATFFKAWCASRDDVAFVPQGIAGYQAAWDISDLADARPALRVTSSETLTSGGGPRTRARSLLQMIHHPSQAPGSSRQEPLLDLAERQGRACRSLYELFPTAAVLVLIRGYRTYLRSLATQVVKMGDVRSGPEHREALLQRSRALLQYDRVVSLYEEAFGADRVTVLPYEMLRADLDAYVAALCRAGGVPFQPFDPGRVNASPPPHALGLIQRVTPAVHAVASRAPEARALSLLRRYQMALRRVYSYPAFDALGRWVGVEPFPDRLFSDDRLREAFAGAASAVARRPEVAPYAAEYFADDPEDG